MRITNLWIIRFAIPALCVFGTGYANAQLYRSQLDALGGGLLQSCDTSLHVGFITTIGNNYFCSFQPVIEAGNTVVQGSTWSYFDGTLSQSFANTLELFYSGQITYPVCLTVDAYDMLAQQPCSTTVCELITPLPDVSCTSLLANFAISSVNGQTITFVDQSSFTTSIVQAAWSFGDGASFPSGNPTNTFPGSGPFEICLTVTGPPPANCTSTLCQWLYLGPGNVECALLADQGYVLLQAGNLVGVLDTSRSSGMNSRVEWDFGDGAIATGPVAVHSYATDGPFELCGTLKVWGPLLADTCTSTLCRTFTTITLVGIDDVVNTPLLQAYPNPFTDRLMVRNTAPGVGSLVVSDALGRTVHRAAMTAGSAVLEMDLGALAPGLYVLHTTILGRPVAIPLLKQ